MKYIKAIIKGGFWLILGILCFSLLGEKEEMYADLQNNGVKTSGEVVSVKYETSGTLKYETRNTYQTVTISYTIEGKNYTVDKRKKMSAFDGEPLKEGQKVTLFVDKDDLSHLEIERDEYHNVWAQVNPWVAVAFITAGLCYLTSPLFSSLRGLFSKQRQRQ